MTNMKMIKAIRKKSVNQNIIFTKAVKGNTIVTINKTDFTYKSTDLISSGNFSIY